MWLRRQILIGHIVLLGLATFACADDYEIYDDVGDEQQTWADSQPQEAQQPPQSPQQPQHQQHTQTYYPQQQPAYAQPAATPQPEYPYAPVYQPRPVVQTTHVDPQELHVPRLGFVRGRIGYKTIKNRLVNAFFGLKYAQVGSGLARFQQATVLEADHNRVIDATREPANCPQWPDLAQVTEKEARDINVDDCLTLNIFAPSQARGLPVIVFVHGEMLFDGSAAEGQPDYFLEHDVVLVSINYRLAPFGFLTTLSDELPGNVALSDIQLALQWVRQHIQAFGGNPSEVTLLGQAAGASLVHALSLSGKAEGLFHKLILQSGTALNPYFIDEDPISTVRSFARIARCPATTQYVKGWHDCFARLRTSELLNVFKQHWEENERHGLRFTGGFKLVVGDRLGFLTQHPASLVTNNNVPTIAGVTKDAGAFILSRFYDQITAIRSSNISDYINTVLHHTAQPRHYQQLTQWALQQIFTAEDVRNPTARDLSQGLLELVNLVLYRSPIVDSVRYTSRKQPTYLYCFDYRGEHHRFGHLDNPLPFGIDATLSDDNIYLFPYPEEVSRLDPQDKTIARVLTTMWVNFATHGIPNPHAGVWPKVSTEYGPVLRITNSRDNALELDVHFNDGIPAPTIYPEYFTTTTTTTTTTTQRSPYAYNPYPNNYNYQNNQPRTQPTYDNYRNDPRRGGYPSYSTNNAQRYAKYPAKLRV